MSQRTLLSVLGAGVIGLTATSTVFAIGFIDSPSPMCRRISGNTCALSWSYVSVNGSPNYVVDLRILLGDEVVFRSGGFFQTSAYISGSDLGDSIRVKCGKAGTTPDPMPTASPAQFGESYSWTIRARDSAGLSSANYGTTICPPR